VRQTDGQTPRQWLRRAKHSAVARTKKVYKKSPANAKGTHDSGACSKAHCEQNLSWPIPIILPLSIYSVLSTLASGRDRYRAAVLAGNRKFFLPPVT